MKINHEQIEADLLAGNYQLGIVKSYEMINGRGKRRVICSWRKWTLKVILIKYVVNI